MVPNTQPPRYVTRPEFNPPPVRPLPEHMSNDLAKIMAAAIPIFLNLQDMSDAMTDLPFQAELLQNAENPMAEEVQDIGDETLLLPTEGVVEQEQTALQEIAQIFAKNIDLGNPLAGQKIQNGATAQQTPEKENAKESPEKPSGQEPKKIVIAQAEQGVNFGKFFEKGAESLIKNPLNTSNPIAVEAEKRAGKEENVPGAKTAVDEKSKSLKQHDWRHLTASDIPLQKPPQVPKAERTEKQPESPVPKPADAKKTNLAESSPKVEPSEDNNMDQPKETPDKIQAKRGNAQDSGSKRIEPEKSIKPRTDMITPLVKKEEPDMPFRFHHPDLLKQLPIAPEQPFTRDGIFRYANQNKNARLKQDEGYRFGDLIFMVFCAVICGAKSSVDVCRYLQKQEKFFKIWLGFKNNIPPFRLFWFLLNRMHPAYLEGLLKNVLGQALSDLAVHVRVWESNRGLILGELNTDHPPQIHLLSGALSPFDLGGAVITLDVPSALPLLFRQIKREGGDFILTLQQSFGDVYEKAHDFFERRPSEANIEAYKQTLEEAQSIDIREIWVSEDIQNFNIEEEMPFVKSGIKLFSESFTENKRLSTSRCYFSSLTAKAEQFSKTLRILSGLENKVEWLADCDFMFEGIVEFERENIMRLQQITSHFLLKHQSGSESLEALRKRASEDNQFLREVMVRLDFTE